MNKALAIKYLYPNAEVGQDYSVRDDGEGQFIDKWLLDDPIPSDEVLEVAWNEYLAKNDEKPLSNVEKQLLVLGEQLALEKIARQQSDRMNVTLGQELAEMRIEILKLKGGFTDES
ncbi:XkdW family protein [Bacillus safensis]|uniref:XkdW family protein n=1 Tax=Bacillus safensis TaxID=561879 RepID=UPI00227F4F41|nr:XkdW family protein [Bacillus safensis]MCY7543883.1 XkdW family protein [Bacillus safensis]MCY7550371.1 XkdW family protein [Bacillus safensis]MCY7644019.1 XkdW family protein [Bacillus safensis]MCY7654543.1 XkdW family protein [Bacillus safensis]MEC3709142.1 XkdW family protein [Bacillus safensis]